MAQTTRPNPISKLVGLREHMDLLYQGWPEIQGRVATGEEILRGVWSPPVEVRETPDRIEVTVELPGVKPDEIHVSVRDNTMTILGQRQLKEIKEGEIILRAEREYGVFERSFPLPHSADPEKIQTKYEDGLLLLTVSMKEVAKSKYRPGEEHRRMEALLRRHCWFSILPKKRRSSRRSASRTQAEKEAQWIFAGADEMSTTRHEARRRSQGFETNDDVTKPSRRPKMALEGQQEYDEWRWERGCSGRKRKGDTSIRQRPRREDEYYPGT